MEAIRAIVQKIRRKVDGEAKYFIPHHELRTLVSVSVVHDAVYQCEFAPWHDLENIEKRVHAGARKIFAILALLRCQAKDILPFLENDNFQESPLDHRLPLPLSALESLVPSIATEFFEKQWEFCSPVFCKDTDHRSLDEFTAMPFDEDRKLGPDAEGGFGKMFLVRIHQGHAPADSSQVCGNALSRAPISLFGQETLFVRKQFPEIDDQYDTSHERELYNLSLLNQLRHPNILELVSFYTYRERRNFLFPFAQSGDMEKGFFQPTRPAAFETDFSILRALSRLSSALEKMHQYTSQKNMELHLIGLHQDLKPKNILVKEGDFILADFGLSRFKPDDESSKTPFTTGFGDYLAPECEDLEDGMKKGIINRGSDIWSFGCIITEVLVYMTFGKQCLDSFRQSRKFRVPGWVLKTFYGPGRRLNQHVEHMLTDLEMCNELHTPLAVRLARQMLRIDQDSRPDAPTVTRKLQFIAVSERLWPIDQLYKTLTETVTSAQAHLEYMRFQSWKHAQGFIDDGLSHSSAPVEFESNFEEATKFLRQAEKELSSILERYELAAHPLFTELRRINDDLLSILPEKLRECAFTYLERSLIEDDDEIAVEKIPDRVNLGESDQLRTRVSSARFIKQLSKRADEANADLARDRLREGKSDLSLDAHVVEMGKPFYEHTTATIAGRQVFVEWIRYDSHWEGQVQEEMIRRVGNIAVILHEGIRRSHLSRLLRLSNYFHSPVQHAFGLMYELPDADNEAIPKSLHTLIHENKHPRSPVLGERFELATHLAATLLDVHRATLLHKSISIFNVMFMSGNRGISYFEPYLVGFNYVRPNDPKAFTEGPPPNENARRYYHPNYTIEAMRRGERFCLAYDYYSLGLVLLEIGLWDNIITTTDADSAEELKQKLLKKRVPLLGFVVGAAYRDAVLACLDGTFGKPGMGNDKVYERFERLVVQPLQHLRA